MSARIPLAPVELRKIAAHLLRAAEEVRTAHTRKGSWNALASDRPDLRADIARARERHDDLLELADRCLELSRPTMVDA